MQLTGLRGERSVREGSGEGIGGLLSAAGNASAAQPSNVVRTAPSGSSDLSAEGPSRYRCVNKSRSREWSGLGTFTSNW